MKVDKSVKIQSDNSGIIITGDNTTIRMNNENNQVNVQRDNAGNIITGDKNIIIQLFSNISITVNKKKFFITLFLFISFIGSWLYFTQKKEIEDRNTTLFIQKQQLRGKITDMIGNPIQGIKVVLPNGESNISNENGEYIFYDVLANENNTIQVNFEYDKNQYKNPDEDNNNNQQLGLEYNPVQLRRLN